jgi:hypothetical protein
MTTETTMNERSREADGSAYEPRFCNGEGPECPFCGREYTADEPHYHDEDGFTIECDECGNEFQVWPMIHITWRTEAVKQKGL